MLERQRIYEGADQAELFGPAVGPSVLRRALAALRKWWAGSKSGATADIWPA